MVVIGLVAAVALVFSTVKEVARPVTRFSSGSPLEVDLRAGANRTIYSGDLAPDGSPTSAVECRVFDVSTGAEGPTTSSILGTLMLGSGEFQSLAHFRVERDGRYRITCSKGLDRPNNMAVGPRLRVFRSVGRVFAAGAAVLLSTATAVAIIAVTAVKRHEHRRRARTS